MNEIKMLTNAIALAADKHKEQTRKDGTPYIYHPMKVAEMVKDAGYSIKYQVVAILHDVLEDTDTTEKELQMFGDDIVEAVKLLTREPNMDEEDYVHAILQNHMAAVVKNADKINNLWDAIYSDDRKWTKKYIAKAKKYYEGKFSHALDHAISETNAMLHFLNRTRKSAYYTADEMMLHSDAEIERYKKRKDLYERCTNRPDLANPQMQYWYNELGDYHFCFIDNENVWSLGRAGWLPLKDNPLHDSEYGEDLWRRKRAEIDKFIEKKKEEHYFYDFVDLSLL